MLNKAQQEANEARELIKKLKKMLYSQNLQLQKIDQRIQQFNTDAFEAGSSMQEIKIPTQTAFGIRRSKKKIRKKSKKTKRRKKSQRVRSTKRKRSLRKKHFGMYQDPMFGYSPAITKIGHLTPYYEYNRIQFPNLGGIRQEVGTGWKNVSIPMGKKVTGPYYNSYNV